MIKRPCSILLTFPPRLASVIPPRIATTFTVSKGSRRLSSTMSRTYEGALAQLAALQSNLAVTSLFAPPAPPAPPAPAAPAAAAASSGSPAQDLNALAIPEMLAWLGRAGISQGDLSGLKCIHVAGTKGKGSVCAYLTSMLTQDPCRTVAGRVGTYTSPHLVTVRERIMLDGQPISQELFARYFFEVWDAFTSSARAEYQRQNPGPSVAATLDEKIEAELRSPATKPFYFRFLTIMAFHVFLEEGVKSAVIECGIGGEYDSTNILPPEAVTASVVTQLGIDHVGMLGGTLPEIAWHKIGIAKPGRKCFTRKLNGEAGEEAMRVMRERTAENRATLVEISDGVVDTQGEVDVRGSIVGGLEGQFQKYNRTLALQAVLEHLGLLDIQRNGDETHHANYSKALEDGLRQARLRGRCETKEDGNITWLIDGAHTADSLQEVAKWFAGKLDSHGAARKVLLFNQQERDVGRLLGVLCDGMRAGSSSDVSPFDRAIFTRNDLNPRTGDEPERDLAVQEAAAEAYKEIYPGSQPVIFDNVADAANEAGSQTSSSTTKTVVLVTGSLHLVGAILQTLEPEAPR